MISSVNSGTSTMSLGLQGYQNAQQKVTQAASDIATRPTNSNLNASVVDLTAGSLQAQASMKVIGMSDKMLGSLIDTLA